VIIDDDGKRWDVADAMSPSPDAPVRPPNSNGRSSQVVLERWRIELKDSDSADREESLPNVYKKAVVLFRSLFSYTRLVPAWEYYKRTAKRSTNQSSLRLKYRIVGDEFRHPRRDTLSLPLYPSSEQVTDTYSIPPSSSPVGALSVSVTYRTNCEFRVDDSESLLSSRFMGVDDDYFKPSLGSPGVDAAVSGSLPVKGTHRQSMPDRGQAYGSLSTFHQVGPATGTSPISALRAQGDPSSQSPPDSSLSQKMPPSQRVIPASKPVPKPAAPVHRRPSVSFQNAFKAGSLSSSPAIGGIGPASPANSAGRGTAVNPLMQPRNRTSLNALPQTALRQPSLPNETAIASSTSSSPKPAPINRFSSSFGHRRSRFSSGGTSKTEDDNTSSGKASVTSSAQPGSGMLNDPDAAASSGSIQTDDDNISDFLKLLEQKKELKSLNRRDSAARDASMRKTTAQLSKYSRMKDSNAVLSDSMSSSLLLHRSSSSSSRQLAAVPQMVHGTSVSTSSSPGKPISPHTPHTPAIPSRLSANSIIEYDAPPHRSRSRGRPSQVADEISHREDDEDTLGHETAAAIPIPTSPRPWPYIRRSSSASQQHPHRALEEDPDVPDIFDTRSASLPNDDRPELSISELLRIHDPVAAETSTARESNDAAEVEADRTPSENTASALSSRPESREDNRVPGAFPSSGDSHPLPYRARIPRTDSRRGSGTPNTSTGDRASRYSFAAQQQAALRTEEDEPLLFYMTMSEMQTQGQGASGRRNVEESRNESSSGRRGSGRGVRRSPWA
jgi:autophagy-related protein 13